MTAPPINALGRVLAAMANFAEARAKEREGYLGQRNTELLTILSSTFRTGAETCQEIAKEEASAGSDRG